MSKIERKNLRDGYLFSAPALIFFVVFTIYPLLYGFVISLYQWNGVGKKTFIGLGNYVGLIQDSAFWAALQHNIIYAVGVVTGKVVIGLLLAILLTRKMKGITFYRICFFMPMMMSAVAVGYLWAYVYNYNFGLINSFLKAIGVPMNHLPKWLGSTDTSLISVIIVELWRWVGYHTVIFIAAIQGIPKELYEAATVDGANALQTHWYITFPQLKSTIILNVMLSLIGAIGTFDLIHVMTDGGPNKSTEMIMTYMYNQAFIGDRFGYASAIAYVAFLIILIFTILQTKVITEG
ncbi:carbohydrate ABC transporter permease [Holdemanella biformis]|uniref:carbohydrate ABC transporter permease n=1 Tax=Holdemanella biformis TaxID=1735 RepID=UPI003AB81A3A